jgi:HSP20 family protein
MDLTKWEPFGGLVRWKPAFCGLDEIVDRGEHTLTTTIFEKPHAGQIVTRSDRWPSIVIIESDGEFLINTEMPDIAREDLKVTIEEGSVVIRGERRRPPCGSFVRSFTLPMDADENNVVAELKDGMLEVHVPISATEVRSPVEIKIR